MPGLVGFSGDICRDDGAERTVRVMQEALRHHSSHVSDLIFIDENVCAARCHANIVNTRPQPCERDGVYVWLDGELYNRDEAGKKFEVTAPDDARFLLECYLKLRKLSFLEDLDGLYSAVIYDQGAKKVHLISDRCGMRHLYWTVRAGWIAWSSEVKAMLALPDFVPRIDRIALEQFIGIGHILENRTVFEGIELLPSGSVLTWDCRFRKASLRRYWWWDRIKPARGKIDIDDAAGELARLLREAVARRCGDRERMGILLSGGLGSRAVLAALPDEALPLQSFTFACEGSPDMNLARQLSRMRGCPHHSFEIDARNWLDGRFDAVWWTDGQMDLKNIHAVPALETIRGLFDVSLNGCAGGLVLGGRSVGRPDVNGNSPLDRDKLALMLGCRAEMIENFGAYSGLGRSDFYMLENRARRFTCSGSRYIQNCAEQRMPYLDNRLVEFVYSLPDSFRYGGRLYHRMLLRTFPEFFKRVPYRATGVPISESGSACHAFYQMVRALREARRRFGRDMNVPRPTVDYPNWLRVEPGRSVIDGILRDPSAFYPDLLSRRGVIEAWEKHLAGEDHTDLVCRCLTLEIWLQQVFEARFRPPKPGLKQQPEVYRAFAGTREKAVTS